MLASRGSGNKLLRTDLIEPRLYQQKIFASATKGNTLVVLPTGTGKTIIAAMLAAYRLSLFPDSKILMMAPSKPLVVQHRETFSRFLNLDKSLLVALTGEVSPEERARLWRRGKIFFATPQVVENDIISRILDLSDFSLLIFDEAHRAVGNYPYVFIAERYMETAKNPLILGLTASPGSDKKRIEEVCRNLFIKRIEVRSENDPDVKPYVQKIDIEWRRIDLPEEFRKVRDLLRSALRRFLLRLVEAGYLEKADPDIPKRALLEIIPQLRDALSKRYVSPRIKEALIAHAAALKIHYALELLETQGISSLRRYLDRLEEQSRLSGARAAKEVVGDPHVREAIKLVRELAEKRIEHPKLRELALVIHEQLKKKPNSKIIVFTQLRDTARKIEEFLRLPGVRPVRFIGQATRNDERGMSQREQIRTLELFEKGIYNVLIATSVGEEGLDIPEVDLVVFYEPVPSEIRAIQRRGRTGRRKPGRVVILIARGTRDEAYYWRSVHKERLMRDILRNLSVELEHVDLGRIDEAAKGIEERKIEEGFSEERESYKTLERFLEEKSESEEERGGRDERALRIIVDHREMRSEVVKDLVRRGAFVEVENLPCGDYIVGEDVAIERKSIEDFLDSLVDGRLFVQARELRKNYRRPVIVIEGEDLLGTRNIHPNSIFGAISSLIVDYGISVVNTRDSSETASLIMALARREQLERRRDVSIRGEKRILSLAEMQRFIVESLPNVGPTLAKKLLKKFRTVERIFTASERELMSVEGIGEHTARLIRRVLTTEYEEN